MIKNLKIIKIIISIKLKNFFKRMKFNNANKIYVQNQKCFSKKFNKKFKITIKLKMFILTKIKKWIKLLLIIIKG